MSYWAAQVHGQRIALALHLLGQRGYSTYFPQIRSERRGEVEALFPSYIFVMVQAQWSPVVFCPGIIRLIGGREGCPSQISDGVIDGLRARERGGLVQLPPAPPPPRLRREARIRITTGLFSGRTGVVALHKGQNGAERLVVLMGMLRVELARGAVEAI